MSTERSAVEPELQRLQQLLVRMAALSEENIRLAVDALRRRDSVRLEEAVAADTVVDLTELEIDELCVSLLALRQPLG
ncbi:MAG TPA: PhoU domain-containing protein, partial [Acidobacteriota bacterium]|nr:PhoU domain-containing protein [Acidobacteriota bacterium]